MDLSRLCSVKIRGVSIDTIAPASIGGEVIVAVTSRAPARLNLSEVRFDIFSTDGKQERVLVHGWAENISLGAYTTTEVPVPVTVTSAEAVRFLSGALTRDVEGRIRGTARIDAYLSKITIRFDEPVTLPSLLSRDR